MPKEVNPQDTTRAAAYALWMKAPNPMVTFFKTFDAVSYTHLDVYKRQELKSGTYRIVLSVTYVDCFALMRLRMPIMIFGIMTIVFCVLYSIVASILVYRLAPKTFRLRT